MVRLLPGQIAVVIRPFGPPSEEIRSLLSPPWPAWARELYAMEEVEDPRIDVEEDETTLGAAVSALSTRMHHRLDLIAWILTTMCELGWEVSLRGEEIVATRVLTPESARLELEEGGVLGPLTKVCVLGDDGLPQLHEFGEGR